MSIVFTASYPPYYVPLRFGGVLLDCKLCRARLWLSRENNNKLDLKNPYKHKIIDETKIKISIEAASTDCWKKYTGKDGLCFGIDTFGKSAPYKEIYKHFGLTSENIASKSKKLFKKKIWL